jgi:hypothetical protein
VSGFVADSWIRRTDNGNFSIIVVRSVGVRRGA